MRPRILLCCLLLLASSTILPAQSETVVVRPVEIRDVLANPGMGIQTFQRFNGQAINPQKGWSEEGPLAARGGDKGTSRTRPSPIADGSGYTGAGAGQGAVGHPRLGAVRGPRHGQPLAIR